MEIFSLPSAPSNARIADVLRQLDDLNVRGVIVGKKKLFHRNQLAVYSERFGALTLDDVDDYFLLDGERFSLSGAKSLRRPGFIEVISRRELWAEPFRPVRFEVEVYVCDGDIRHVSPPHQGVPGGPCDVPTCTGTVRKP